VQVALVGGKRTLVDRELLPSFLAIATEDAPWQTDGLADGARRLLAFVRRRGVVRVDEIPPTLVAGKAAADAAQALEARLLARGGNVHTESGAHVKTLEHWERIASEAGAPPPWPGPAAARATFSATADRWEREHGARPSFPWEPAPRRVRTVKAREPAAKRAAKPKRRDERRPARRPSAKRRPAAG
jgi:hypothetical protein